MQYGEKNGEDTGKPDGNSFMRRFSCDKKKQFTQKPEGTEVDADNRGVHTVQYLVQNISDHQVESNAKKDGRPFSAAGNPQNYREMPVRSETYAIQKMMAVRTE